VARNKPTAKKRRLARAGKTKQAVPAWVIAKTRGTVRFNPKQKPWRRSKLKA